MRFRISTARAQRVSLAITLVTYPIVLPHALAYAGDADNTFVASTASANQPGAELPPKDKQTSAPGTVNESPSTLGAVTVTGGMRESLKNAQDIKQGAEMVVDAIVAQDIGKLPDNSVAEALQRVTGVQVAPGPTGEINSVVIRGLPNVQTTLDGNDMYSALGSNPNLFANNQGGGGSGRGFDFADLPATAVRALNVYKSSDATLRPAISPAWSIFNCSNRLISMAARSLRR